MVAETEYYDLLGLNPGEGDEKKIKKAYKKSALKWHPDRNPDNQKEAEEKFKKIGEAYQVLTDPEKKKLYDQFGKKGLEGGAGGMGGAGGFSGGAGTRFEFRDASDIFSQMFGGRDPFDLFGSMGGGGFGGRGTHFGAGFDSDEDDIFSKFGAGGSRQPSEVRHTVNVTLEDLNKQKKKKIKMTLPSGEKKVFEFDLHGKMKSGTKVRYANALQNGQDLVFELHLKPHHTFEKRGVDLVLKRTISLADALAGCRFPVTRLDGTILNVDTKSKVIRPGTVYRIQNEGLPHPGGRGNLQIEFSIQFPDSLTPDQRQQIRQLFP